MRINHKRSEKESCNKLLYKYTARIKKGKEIEWEMGKLAPW